MTVRKFRFSLSEVPSELHQDDGGDSVVKLRLPTLTGHKTITLRDQEVVRTEDDPLVDHALENYHPPKIPLQHHPSGVPTVAYHNYADHAAKRPFTEVATNTTHHHVL